MSNEPRVLPANKHKVDIGNNPALSALYIMGSLGLGAGVVFFLIASYAVTQDSNPAGALGWQGFGALLANASFFLFAGALVVYAVNWQIGRLGPRA